MPSPKPKYREVSEPSISANQLAQYLGASPITRKRIISGARWQSTAVVTRYKLARSAITDCLCDMTKSPQTLNAHRAKLVERLASSSNTAWVTSDLEASIEALDRYGATLNQTGLNKYACKPIMNNPPPLIISGLKVRVTPDALIEKWDSKNLGKDVGAIISLIAKGENSGSKRKDVAKTAAVLVWMFCEKHLSGAGTPSRKLCLSYDVFDGTVVPAGANVATRINNITAACEEIALAWDHAIPPADIDS